MRTRTLAIIAIICVMAASFVFPQAPQHARLLYENPLTSDDDDTFATATNYGGTFIAGGWKAERDSKLTLQLKNRLPAVGSIEFSITNFNPVLQTTNGKQTLFAFTSRPHSRLSLFYEDSLSSFTFLRTGTNYVNGDRCGLEFDTAYEGAKSRDKDREVLMDKKWYGDETYHVKFVWDHDYIWLYFNGQEVKKQLMKGPIERIQHISIGGDDIYNTLAGPVYSNVKIYTAASAVRFDDKTFSKSLTGLNESKGGHGLAVVDVNGDGLDDIFVANYADNESLADILYIQQPDNSYRDETLARGLSNSTGSFSALFFDADNDGDADLFCCRLDAENTLYLNDGTGHFVDESAARGISSDARRTGVAVAFDADNDGDIDLLAVNQDAAHDMYINDGGHFTMQDRGFHAGGATASDMPSATVVDFDNDGDADVYLSWPGSANELYVNDGDGYFTEQAAQHNIDFAAGSQGALFADYDNDGDSDLFLSLKVESYTADSLFLNIYRNDGSGVFSSPVNRMPMNGYSAQVFDADNDGLLDIYCLQNNQFDRYYEKRTWNFFRTSMAKLFLGIGDGQFVDSGDCGVDIVGSDARSFVADDFDGDGDIDLYLTTAQFENVFLENNSGAASGHWIDLTLIGPAGDYGGIGSKIWLYEPGRLGDAAHLLAYREVVSQGSYLAANNPGQHFGLGDFISCDVRVQRVDGSVQERSGLTSNSRYTLSPDVYHLQYVSGDGQTGFINEPIAEPFVVAVFNQDNQSMAAIPVSFRIMQGTASFQGDSSTFTNAAGQAQAQLIAGEAPGAVVVQASLENGQGSPVEFHASISRPEYLLTDAGGDQQTGAVGETLEQAISIRVVDSRGLNVANHQVQFSVVAGGGHVLGDSVHIVTSDEDGLAFVPWTLGPVVGENRLLASTEDDTIRFTATAHAAAAAEMQKRGGDGQELIPGKEFDSPFSVFVGDAYGNAVPGVVVRFSVENGGGHLRGAPVREAATDTAGLASVFWTPGPYLGPENRLHAAALGGSISEVNWIYPGIAVDAAMSTLTATSPLPADGASQSHIVATLKDNLGQPLGAGLTIKLSATGSQNYWTVNDTLTDENGRVEAFLSTLTPETKIITAKVSGLNMELESTAHVEFEPLPQAPGRLEMVSGDGQTGVVGKALEKPLVVRLFDTEGTGMPDYPVRFQLQKRAGKADTVALAIVTTGEDGRAAFEYVFGERPGETTIAAIVDSVDGSPLSFNLLALPDAASALTMVSGDSQTVDSGSPLSEPLVVKLADRYGNVLAGQAVVFTAVNGGHVLTPQPVTTDSAGLARCQAALPDSGSTFYFMASHDSLHSVLFTAFARQVDVNHPPVIEAVSPVDSLLVVDYNHRLLFKITASDQDNDPLFYEWLLGHALVSDSSSFSFTAFPTLPSPVHITALVYDLKDTTRQSWTVMFNPTAVELSAFKASSVPGVGVVLSWRTPDDFNAIRFDVLKSDKEEGRYETIQTISAIHARSHSYEFIDNNVSSDGVSYYKLKTMFADGRSAEWGPVSAAAFVPTKISLHANYPNPFNPATTIRFELPGAMNVALQIFNAKGQIVKTLEQGEMNAGYHTVQWRADSDNGMVVPSGIYYCRLTADGRVMIRKMLLLK